MTADQDVTTSSDRMSFFAANYKTLFSVAFNSKTQPRDN